MLNDRDAMSEDACSPREALVLGVDGGGTKTMAALAQCGRRYPPAVIGNGCSGPSNPQAVGIHLAQSRILRAVHEAFVDAGRAPVQVAAICIGLAGAGRSPLQQELQQWGRQQRLASRVLVVHDARLVLREGTSRGSGIALIAGTGSFCCGANDAGETARAGGWGHLLGDEGGGYGIGMAALQALTRTADGRGPVTLLTQRILAALGLQSPSDMIASLSTGAPPREQIAALAPIVLQAAAEGDAVAVAVQEQAARELAELVIAVHRQLALDTEPYELAMAGGVLTHHTSYQQDVLRHLEQAALAPSDVAIVSHPVLGAILLADEAIR